MTESRPVSRRGLFRRLANVATDAVRAATDAAVQGMAESPSASGSTPPPRSGNGNAPPAQTTRTPEATAGPPVVAWIHPADCLAYRHTVCTVCSERCPEPGAITLTRLRPTINGTACTGCGICQQVCPAPANPVLLLPPHVAAGRRGGN